MLTNGFETSRLWVNEVISVAAGRDFLLEICQLLTPPVVENLPPYFHGIHGEKEAQQWLATLLADSQLYRVMTKAESTLVGFVFVYVDEHEDAHIGYLLGESHWGQGYATELLIGLIGYIQPKRNIQRLVAGVGIENKVSSKLLKKVGFTAIKSAQNETQFFEYPFLDGEI